MWWSNTKRRIADHGALGGLRLLAAALPLLLTACGWHPLYGKLDDTGGAGLELASVHIQPIADRTGQNLYNELRDRINPSGVPIDPHYDLVIGLTELDQQFLVQTDQTATRVDLTIYANFALYQRGGTAPLMIGQSRSTTTYDQLTNQYASVVSAQDARRRGAAALADDIANRLAVYLAQPPDQRPAPPPAPASTPAPPPSQFGG
jgi:LPS-assembly lipoprotein